MTDQDVEILSEFFCSKWSEGGRMVADKLVVPPPPPCPLPSLLLCPRTASSCQNSSSLSINSATKDFWERLFDQGYRADVVVHTDNGGLIYAHANILCIASPVIRHMLKHSKGKDRKRSISIYGVPHESVRVFVRFLYSSCCDFKEMEEFVLQLLVLSHVFVVPHLKKMCQERLENGLVRLENVIDVFQLALLCDAPRLSLICHRLILDNFKAVSTTEGWIAMKEAHPILEKEILDTVVIDETRKKELCRKQKERKMYIQLYEVMEALVHIYKDGCKTIGPHDKAPKNNEEPCGYQACKGLEMLVRHFVACELKVPAGCSHCKRMWQLLKLHSRLCADSDQCRVPLCRKFKRNSRKQNKKEEMKWKTLARKILRSKSISGAPFFSIVATSL